MALAPAVSGNAINGLGEASPRRPRVIYWAPDPDSIPHGAMQRWFYGVDPRNPEIAQAREERARMQAVPMPEVAGTRIERGGPEWNAALDEKLATGLCELWGVARMQDAWVYEGHQVRHRNIVMLGVVHDYAAISQAPAPTAGAEVVRQYGRAAAAAKSVAGWLRLQGWEAEPLTGPMTTKVALIPPALACGFGELGKHGSIIHPRYGASFRLAAVLTDAPFDATPPRESGIDDFCSRCKVCEEACPPEAIAPVKQLVRGEHRWYVDFDRCLPFFNQTQGCAICIATCPWSRPGVAANLLDKLGRRAARAAAR